MLRLHLTLSNWLFERKDWVFPDSCYLYKCQEDIKINPFTTILQCIRFSLKYAI